MFSKLCFEQQGQGMDIPKGSSAVLCNQKTVAAKHQRHMHERNTRRAAKAPLGLLLLFVWSGCFSKQIALCSKGRSIIFVFVVTEQESKWWGDGCLGQRKRCSRSEGPPLPGPFQEKESLWNENAVTDLEGTHPRFWLTGSFGHLGNQAQPLRTFTQTTQSTEPLYICPVM